MKLYLASKPNSKIQLTNINQTSKNQTSDIQCYPIFASIAFMAVVSHLESDKNFRPFLKGHGFTPEAALYLLISYNAFQCFNISL